MAKTNEQYGNDSISQLKGADRVRKRPAVIFGSDGIEGCQHSFFEILSNSIDEAREGFGEKIVITRYLDHSLEVQDYGRGIPMDYNEKEKEFNWKLVFCELYAGGKYNNDSGSIYEYSLGLNGLGLCATQYSSEYKGKPQGQAEEGRVRRLPDRFPHFLETGHRSLHGH